MTNDGFYFSSDIRVIQCLAGKQFKKNIKKEVGDSAFNNWLKHLSYVSLEETTITFSVPTKFLRDWIVNNYSDKITVPIA